MKKAKTKTLVSILTVLIMLLIPIITLAADPPAPVAKTGQTICYADNETATEIPCSDTGQDGDLQIGVASPSPRFTDNGDETVTDNLTGLMWAKNANPKGLSMNWSTALDYANNLSLGGDECGYGPECGGCGQPACELENCREDWRLPNRFELESLLDLSNYDPALPTGHPFTNVQGGTIYWSSTTHVHYADSAWNVGLSNGYVSNNYKTGTGFPLPVRGPDSDVDCITGTTQPCGSDVGECQSGIQTCIIGQWGACEGETGPSPEICDGVDNNCDGQTDEGFGVGLSCGSGICSGGLLECNFDGSGTQCSTDSLATSETCDGIDNNCDAVVDENCDCIDGTQQLCEKQFGVCSGSTKICIDGEWPVCDQNNFPPDYEPVETSCSDEKDNDCDGQTDIGDIDCS